MLQDEDAEEGNVDQSNPILNASTPNTNESEGDVPSSPTPLMKSGDTKEGIEPLEIENDDTGVVAKRCPVPDMWSWDYVGLYCQYAAVGLLYGKVNIVVFSC